MLRSSSLTTLTVPPQVSPEKPQDAKPRKFEMRDEFASETGSPQIKAIQIHSGVDSLHGSPQKGGSPAPADRKALVRSATTGNLTPRSAAAANTNQLPAAAPAALSPLQGERTWSPPRPGHRKAPSLKPPAGFVPISVEPPADADAVPVETLPSPKARAAAAFGVRLNAAGPPASSPHAWGGAAPPSDASPEHAALGRRLPRRRRGARTGRARARARGGRRLARRPARSACLGPASHRRRGGLRGRPLPRRRGGGGAPPRDGQSRGGGGDAKAAAGSHIPAPAAVEGRPSPPPKGRARAADRGAPVRGGGGGRASGAGRTPRAPRRGERSAPAGASCATAAARRARARRLSRT